MDDGRLVPRQIPAAGVAGRLADRLQGLAEQVRRLEPPVGRDEQATFFWAKDHLARQIADLARVAERGERLD
jgi:hypothetical protein